ncbi:MULTISPECIES: GNAT family N-acetyltransferase [unclassified Microbacterium]|uniref:GNAT family N-acetyltransferase n=1 Tax=unclassified Microbacterium TaxID=2609290 RepID=UPI000DE3B064|nr:MULTISPECIES: GNAT family N-acetyltransferase [unclassified Microbacterium]NYF29916.1 GNAT superfamily N-acetyltransferase [Microbacterium sp. JAI119]RBO72575.1 GNAT family N-acetyltransferase [Microbacterium sp. H6]
MATITTELATMARWDDVQHALTGGGDGASCQCIWPVLSNKDWNTTTTPQRTEMFRAEIDEGPPPGIVASVDGEAAGWIRIGPRTRQARVARTRIIAAASTEPFDDESVWAVTCFVVRREHRGSGLNLELLRAAVEYARESGARLIEGYPVDTRGEKQRSNGLFHGTLGTFLAAGFMEQAELKPGRTLVALSFDHVG